MHENMILNDEPTSLELVKKSDVFPKKILVSEDDRLRVPFPLLSGESAEYLGRTADGVVVLTNFRLLIRYVDSFINVPLGLIESVEIRDIFYLHVYCKDATAVRCAFSTNDTCQDWFKRLSIKTAPCRKLDDTFAFAFHAWCIDRNRLESDTVLEGCYQLCPINKPKPYSFTAELERMKFDLKKAWQYTEVNKDFSICSSYPKEHIIPKSVSEERLRKVADFRALQRFPTIVWRNCQNGAVLVRCGQPEIGWLGWRNTDDEKFLEAIPLACAMNPGTRKQDSDDDDRLSGSSLNDEDEDESTVIEEPKKMLIIDCRSYGAAFANRAKGGGVECPEYYPSCEIQFMNLANIHTIRKSFVALRQLCSNGPEQASWLSNLDNTKWLQNMSSLIKAATLVVINNDKEGRSVLVHCSDGWDRTPQIITLAEVMLDPYYRTVEGFEVLIEREWLDFGHKFADRNGNGVHLEDVNERCPVFMQWLECVYQLLLQFPCKFEFNEAFLVKLVHHTYSCLFGTFLCNTSQERIKHELDTQTASVWSLLQDKQFYNKLYSPSYANQVLHPKCQVNSLQLWTSLYLSTNSSFASPDEVHLPCNQTVPIAENGEAVTLPKTRSCENLLSLTDHTASPSRRRSDPNITMELGEQTTKLLKDAMAGQDGDTSCSSESIRSSNNTSFSDNVNELVNGHEKESSSIQNSSNREKVTMNHNGETIMNGHVTDEESVNGELANRGEYSDDNSELNGDTNFRILVNGFNGHVNGINGHESLENGSVGEHIEMLNIDVSSSKAQQLGIDSEINDRHMKTDGAYSDSERINHDVNLCNSIPNGNGDDDKLDNEEIVPNSSSDKILQRKSSGDKVETTLEGSTDTLIEDGVKDLQKDNSGHTLTPSSSTSSGKVYEVKTLKSLCDKSSSSNKLMSLDQTSSISTATSTSDLTDSRVGQDTSKLNGALRHVFQNSGPCDTVHNSLKLKCILAQSVLPNGNINGCSRHGVNGEQRDGSPSCSTSLSPQSRTSTCPPTPGTSDGKSIDTQVQRQQSGIGKHLDWDGLTTFNDPVQQQIDKIETKCEERLQAMIHQMTQLQNLFAHTASACNGEVCSHDFRKAEQESPGSCDLNSIQSNYSNASDASWDHMEDPEVNVQYWVPDHMVTHCAGCEIKFSLTVRKHHCRNCGKVFCNTCSSESMPLPHQMVHTPERVCAACYKNLSNLLTKSIIELESGQTMAAAASN